MTTDYEMPLGGPLEGKENTARIREQNDAFRCAGETIAERYALGELFVTRGVAEHGNEFVARALQAVRSFAEFPEDNDPHGEHDFGSFEQDGETLSWKIDCYDSELNWRSPNPADPAETRRVLTIMLAGEY